MKAFTSKYIPATNTKPTRIKVSCGRGSHIVSLDKLEQALIGTSKFHRFADEELHHQAVIWLIKKFVDEDKKKYGAPIKGNPWARPFSTGQIPSGEYVHVYNQK